MMLMAWDLVSGFWNPGKLGGEARAFESSLSPWKYGVLREFEYGNFLRYPLNTRLEPLNAEWCKA